MALHRDIFWIGRQWAVTGHGMQLIDQRLEGAFDIEVARLWDDDLIESLRAKAWLKADGFRQGAGGCANATSAVAGGIDIGSRAGGSCDRADRASAGCEAGSAEI